VAEVEPDEPEEDDLDGAEVVLAPLELLEPPELLEPLELLEFEALVELADAEEAVDTAEPLIVMEPVGDAAPLEAIILAAPTK